MLMKNKLSKDKLAVLKKVRKYLSARYLTIFNYLYNTTNDEKSLAIQNIYFLIENEHYFLDVISELKKQKQELDSEALFQEKTSSKINEQEYIKAYIIDRIESYKEALNRVKNKNASSLLDIQEKEKKIQKYSDKLNELQLWIADINDFIKKIQPQGRKPGRPKKYV